MNVIKISIVLDLGVIQFPRVPLQLAMASNSVNCNANGVEFCVTTGEFTGTDRERALAALDETEFKPSPPPVYMNMWEAKSTG